jgi:hypothetical protein
MLKYVYVTKDCYAFDGHAYAQKWVKHIYLRASNSKS